MHDRLYAAAADDLQPGGLTLIARMSEFVAPTRPDVMGRRAARYLPAAAFSSL